MTGADWVDSARRLLDTLRPPASGLPPEPVSGLPPEPASGLPPEPPADGVAHGADCRWCPVCQTAAVLRGERPEVTAALADVLATTAAVLRDLAGEPGRSAPSPAEPAPPAEGEDPGPAPVQRIDIA